MFDADERSKLDFSLNSLDIVEAWILGRYSDTDLMLPESESQTVNRLACYIGETMLRLKGGRWELQLNPDDVFYGVPVIARPDGDVECPLSLATASADRRTGDFLRSVVGDE